MQPGPAQWVAPLAILAIACGVVPLINSSYLFEAILVPFLALSLAALGLNLLTGYAGQVSLGSAAFMAVGAFTAYNFAHRVHGLPLVMILILAGLAAAAIGLVFGLPSLRLRGFYLAVSTLAAQFFVQWALTKFGWFSNDNLGRHRRSAAAGCGDQPRQPDWALPFALTIVVVTTALVYRLVNLQTGRNFVAVRDNETAARVIGVPVLQTKLLAFGLSSFIIGVAGVIWAFAYLRTVEPAGFNLDRSFQILFIIIIGGLASIRGAFFGAALIVVFPLVLSRVVSFLPGDLFDIGSSST